MITFILLTVLASRCYSHDEFTKSMRNHYQWRTHPGEVVQSKLLHKADGGSAGGRPFEHSNQHLLRSIGLAMQKMNERYKQARGTSRKKTRPLQLRTVLLHQPLHHHHIIPVATTVPLTFPKLFKLHDLHHHHHHHHHIEPQPEPVHVPHFDDSLIDQPFGPSSPAPSQPQHHNHNQIQITQINNKRQIPVEELNEMILKSEEVDSPTFLPDAPFPVMMMGKRRRRRSADAPPRLNRRSHRAKRYVSLIKMVTDPETKIDIPQTMQNVADVTRNAIDDNRGPVHYLKNMIGSARDAAISAMNIPPVELFVPSNYEIVSKADPEMVKSIMSTSRSRENNVRDKEDDEPEHWDEFVKVGEMLRKSILSAQESVHHVGGMLQSARQAVVSSQKQIPKLIVPYYKTPVAMPRKIFTRGSEDTSAARREDGLLPLGDLLQAYGVFGKPAKPARRSRFPSLEELGARARDRLESHHRLGHFGQHLVADIHEKKVETLNNLKEYVHAVLKFEKLKDELHKRAPTPAASAGKQDKKSEGKNSAVRNNNVHVDLV